MTSSQSKTGPVPKGDEGMGGWHLVAQGESVYSIAARHGLPFQKIWSDPHNKELRARGRKENILLPGDWIFLPTKELREEDVATETRNRYRKRVARNTLKLRLAKGRGPRHKDSRDNGKEFEYRVQIGAVEHKGTSRDGEVIELQNISPETERVDLFVFGRQIRLSLNALDPETEPSGIEQRMKALGYASGLVGKVVFDHLNELNQNATQEELLQRLQALHKGDG